MKRMMVLFGVALLTLILMGSEGAWGGGFTHFGRFGRSFHHPLHPKVFSRFHSPRFHHRFFHPHALHRPRFPLHRRHFFGFWKVWVPGRWVKTLEGWWIWIPGQWVVIDP